MNQSVLNPEQSVLKRTAKVRNAYQKASPQEKSKILELIPFSKKSKTDSNVIDFCSWEKWSKWTQYL